jgi:hypothetical protein
MSVRVAAGAGRARVPSLRDRAQVISRRLAGWSGRDRPLHDRRGSSARIGSVLRGRSAPGGGGRSPRTTCRPLRSTRSNGRRASPIGADSRYAASSAAAAAIAVPNARSLHRSRAAGGCDLYGARHQPSYRRYFDRPLVALVGSAGCVTAARHPLVPHDVQLRRLELDARVGGLLQHRRGLPDIANASTSGRASDSAVRRLAVRRELGQAEAPITADVVALVCRPPPPWRSVASMS